MQFNKNLAIGLFSCSIESYTASIYVFAGPELKSQIFPYLSPDSATFFHYLIIALGLLCYPLGGYLFGCLGDNLGRKKALAYSSLGLAVSTGLLGLIPLGLTGGLFVYLPAILFTGLFCLQHFCAGGDYNSSAIFTVEHVKTNIKNIKNQKYKNNKNHQPNIIYYSSLACVMSVLGLISAQFMGGSGLWRVACITGFIGAIFAYFIRKKSEETPIFLNKINHNNKIFTQSIISNKSIQSTISITFEKSLVFIFAGFLCAVYYFIFIFLTPHLFTPNVFTPEGYAIREINIGYFILYALSLGLGGIIISKSSTPLLKTIQNLSFILVLLLVQFAFIFYQLDLSNPTPALITTASILIGILVIFLGLIIAPQHALYLDLFPNQNRCQAIITSFTLGAATIGGITPFLCKLIYKLTGNLGVTALWPAACTGVLLVSLIMYNGRNRASIKIISAL